MARREKGSPCGEKQTPSHSRHAHRLQKNLTAGNKTKIKHAGTLRTSDKKTQGFSSSRGIEDDEDALPCDAA